jgi:plastocyanin
MESGSGRSWTYTARRKGEIDCICRLHPVMHGTLIVK